MDSYWNTDKKIYYITTFNNKTAHTIVEYINCIKMFSNFYNLSDQDALEKWQKRKIEFLSF